ncbi:hypothetical protein ACD578_15885 [Microvirga sp. RSM25]|uniref:hypothetical protein n=1 Tax=Microvirga sp. RSM25 TaxID=3273802 RepID=UPI00384A8492
MSKAIGAIGVCLMMAGCVSASDTRQAEIDASIQQGRDACVGAYRSKQIKTYAGYMQCLNTAEAPLAARASGSGLGDLWNVKMAGRVAIAERVDKGQISPAQADLEMAQLNSNLMSTGQSRVNAAAAVSAQQQAAAAAYKPVTCNRFGYSVTCF